LNEAEECFDRASVIVQQLPDNSVGDYLTFEAPRLHGALLNNQAIMARQRGDFDGAINLLDQAIVVQRRALDLEQRDPWVKDYEFRHHRDRAETFLFAGRHREAAEAVDRMVQEFSAWQQAYHRGAELLLLCADLSTDSGDVYRKRAREFVEKAEKSPTRTTVSQDHLAWFLLTRPDESFRDPQRALRLVKSVTKTVPERLPAWRTLSLAHYRLGDWDKAEHALRASSFRGEPEDATALFLRSMIHWQQGRQTAARGDFERAKELVEKTGALDDQVRSLQREAAALFDEQS
jgi:tetratricopeptide (TPR) repeat protein